MRIVIQRVKEAQVTVGDQVIGQVKQGMLVFLAVGKNDSAADVDYLVDKIIHLRIFGDSQGKMNLPALDVKAEFLVISQFTILGDCVKGRRPSFDQAADPQKAEDLYDLFISRLQAQSFKVESGQFKAKMDVSLVNDGPVTFILESKQ
ncbi:MAG: D-aminoacyl-tRNA deacylase [Candidatus Omnitrophota bacterium]